LPQALLVAPAWQLLLKQQPVQLLAPQTTVVGLVVVVPPLFSLPLLPPPPHAESKLTANSKVAS
jgi:hypothetical protein